MMTAEEYLALPDDGNRYELWHGDLVMSPSADHAHGRVTGHVFRRLDEFVEARSAGVVGLETDMVMSRTLVLRPDVHFVSFKRASIIRGLLHGPPDLVVEVTSPGNWQQDVYDKRDEYEAFGIREYWVLDIADGRNRAFAWKLRAGQYQGGLVKGKSIESRVLKGFELFLSEVWKRAKGISRRR
jgi:Uma2 family endonuclease